MKVAHARALTQDGEDSHAKVRCAYLKIATPVYLQRRSVASHESALHCPLFTQHAMCSFMVVRGWRTLRTAWLRSQLGKFNIVACDGVGCCLNVFLGFCLGRGFRSVAFRAPRGGLPAPFWLFDQVVERTESRSAALVAQNGMHANKRLQIRCFVCRQSAFKCEYTTLHHRMTHFEDDRYSRTIERLSASVSSVSSSPEPVTAWVT